MTTQTRVSLLFQKGLYQEAIDCWEEMAVKDTYSGTFALAALCFLGRRWEAEEFPSEFVNEFGRNFFLGVAMVRESDYEGAKKRFLANQNKIKNSKDDFSRFFTWQGMGFFQFFTGEVSHLLVSAEKAYRASLRCGLAWGQAMALDLVAHGLFYRGRIQEALSTFDRAMKVAERADALDLVYSFQMSKACYQSQISLKPGEAIRALQNLEKALHSQDVLYTNSLSLEIFRQLVHSGRLDEAKDFFAKISPEIYASKNRRQIFSLLHRYAYLLFLQGASMEAITVLRSSRMNLSEEVDKFHLLRSYGLEEKISAYLKEPQLVQIQQKIEELNKQASTAIGRRVQSRRQEPFKPAVNMGQDPLGDLIDQAKLSTNDALRKLAVYGLFGLIPGAMGWKPLSSRIVLDVQGSIAVVCIRGQCTLSAKPIKGVPRKLLELLREKKVVTKEQCIRRVWGYTYHSARHDTLLYSAFHQLRQQIGVSEEVFEQTSSGYRLNIPVYDMKKAKDEFVQTEEVSILGETERKRSNAPFFLPEKLTHLNARQISLLRNSSEGVIVNVRGICRQFKVSHMTAFRDLTQLAEEGFFQRVGNGRSTCYIKSAKRSL